MPQYDLPGAEALPPDLRQRRVVFVTNARARSLEYMGPLQVLDEARIFLETWGRPELAYRVEFVSAGEGPLYQRKGFSIDAAMPYHRLRGDVDTLIFQAADEGDVCLHDERFIAWVARMAQRVRRVVSICTGSFILAQAGVLDGRRATTHWCAVEDFRRRYPRVQLEPEAIYVKDGHVYSSAGATSGMDLTIALVEEDFGSEFARRVAQGLVMFLRRPGNQAQFAVQVATEQPAAEGARDFQDYVLGNLAGDLRIEALADRFHMSPRNFARVFAAAVGVPPGRYVEQCRVERARQLLEETSDPLGSIARTCGYATPDGLRVAFERNLGVSPRAYRSGFATAKRDQVHASGARGDWH